MQCPKCGNEIPDGNLFCGICGTSTGESNPTEEHTNDENLMEPLAQNDNIISPTKGHKKLFVLMAAILSVLILGTVGFILLANPFNSLTWEIQNVSQIPGYGEYGEYLDAILEDANNHMKYVVKKYNESDKQNIDSFFIPNNENFQYTSDISQQITQEKDFSEKAGIKQSLKCINVCLLMSTIDINLEVFRDLYVGKDELYFEFVKGEIIKAQQDFLSGDYLYKSYEIDSRIPTKSEQN